MTRFALHCLVFLALASTASAATPLPAFFKAHCTECHDAETKKGNLDLTAHSKKISIWPTRTPAGLAGVGSAAKPQAAHTAIAANALSCIICFIVCSFAGYEFVAVKS